MHTAAREMVYVAEQGLMADGKNTLDPTWQEMLNHATAKVNNRTGAGSGTQLLSSQAARRRRLREAQWVLCVAGQRGGGRAAAQREGAHARHARLPGGGSARADAAEVSQKSHCQIEALL